MNRRRPHQVKDRAINNHPNRKDHLSGSRDRSRKRGANKCALTYHCLACVCLCLTIVYQYLGLNLFSKPCFLQIA